MSTFLTRVEGQLPSGESWSIGIHTTGSVLLSAVQTASDNFEDVLWNGNGGSAVGLAAVMVAAVTVSSVVVYQLDPGSLRVTARSESNPADVGVAAGSSLPQECAVVASLRSATPGPIGRGRLYLPCPAASVLTTAGRLNAGDAQNMADSVAIALGEFASAALTPGLVTQATGPRAITSVDVGDVFDAQRRRRDKLIESRYTHSV